MKQIQKRKSHAFGKDVYLLGRDKSGEYVWLEAATWDCGWYWGFGYIERYTNSKFPERARDISSHTHWDSEIVGRHEVYNHEKGCFVLSAKHVYHLNDSEYFVESVLGEGESWRLAELMKSFYTLKKSAEMFGRGGSHVTTDKREEEILKREVWAKEINEKILPELFKEIYAILSPERDGAK